MDNNREQLALHNYLRNLVNQRIRVPVLHKRIREVTVCQSPFNSFLSLILAQSELDKAQKEIDEITQQLRFIIQDRISLRSAMAGQVLPRSFLNTYFPLARSHPAEIELNVLREICAVRTAGIPTRVKAGTPSPFERPRQDDAVCHANEANEPTTRTDQRGSQGNADHEEEISKSYGSILDKHDNDTDSEVLEDAATSIQDGMTSCSTKKNVFLDGFPDVSDDSVSLDASSGNEDDQASTNAFIHPALATSALLGTSTHHSSVAPGPQPCVNDTTHDVAEGEGEGHNGRALQVAQNLAGESINTIKETALPAHPAQYVATVSAQRHSYRRPGHIILDPPLPSFPASCPKSLIRQVKYIYVPLGALYAQALRTWFEYQDLRDWAPRQHGFPAKIRPAELTKWIRASRPDKPSEDRVHDLRSFIAAWNRWWDYIAVSNCSPKAGNGQSGWYLHLVCLKWWRECQGNADEQWEGAVQKVTQAPSNLAREEAARFAIGLRLKELV
ncbi:hypothetical protein K523DRAFT_334541 [Schizophyllum commune Tattone D]|nr:hypothetical protein K523DRAFT_334541 [Schizophyllum commune Tattone D]